MVDAEKAYIDDHSKVRDNAHPSKSVNTLRNSVRVFSVILCSRGRNSRGGNHCGYQYERLTNIDHHAPTERMARIVSRTVGY